MMNTTVTNVPGSPYQLWMYGDRSLTHSVSGIFHEAGADGPGMYHGDADPFAV